MLLSQRRIDPSFCSKSDRQTDMYTLYPQDAVVRGINIEHQAQQIVGKLNLGLKKAKEERQQIYLIKQVKLVGAIALIVLLVQLIIQNKLNRSYRAKTKLQSERLLWLKPFSDYINQKQRLNLRLL